MPEFKVAAVKVSRTGSHASPTDARDLALHEGAS
jgi:hypothetical protein